MKNIKWIVIIITLIFVALFIAKIFSKGFDRVFASTILGSADPYGVLASTYTDTSAATTINGDVGFTTPPATAPTGVHTNYGSGSPYAQAGIDQSSALTALNGQTCDFSFVGAQDLSLLVQPLTPGVYCTVGAQSVGVGGITLVAGNYVFRSTGALNTVANSVVSGGEACNVFWTPVATTLGANSIFRGTIIDDAGITVGSTVTWTGRALAFGGTVTTDADTITVPSCTTPIPPATVNSTVNSPPTYSFGSGCAYGYNFANQSCNYNQATSTPIKVVPPTLHTKEKGA